MGWRLAPAGLRVIYDAGARSFMARPIDFDAFCARTEAKGRAHAHDRGAAPRHRDRGAAARSRTRRSSGTSSGTDEPLLRRRVAELEARQPRPTPAVLPELHEAYRETFRLLHAKGAAGTGEGETRR